MNKYHIVSIVILFIIVGIILPNKQVFGKQLITDNASPSTTKTQTPATIPACCEICPQHFYEELALIEVPLSHKVHAIKKFHKHLHSNSNNKYDNNNNNKNNDLNFIEEQLENKEEEKNNEYVSIKDKSFTSLMSRKGGSKGGKTSESKGSVKKKKGGDSKKGGDTKKKSKSSTKSSSSKNKKSSNKKSKGTAKSSSSKNKKSSNKKSKGKAKSSSSSSKKSSKSSKKSSKSSKKSSSGKKNKKGGRRSSVPKLSSRTAGAVFPFLAMTPFASKAAKPLQPQLSKVKLQKPPVGMYGGGKCCPICAADFLPPTDYREITEPAGSTHVWAASLLEEHSNANGLSFQSSKSKKSSRKSTTSKKMKKSTRKTSKKGGKKKKTLPAKEKTKGDRMAESNNIHHDIPCCDVCIAQMYPPRDYMDVTEFIEVMETVKMKAKDKIETRNKLKAKGPAVPCGCRLCQYKMTGSYTSMKENRTPQKLPLKRPRNPMNHRRYSSTSVSSASSTVNSLGNVAANTAANMAAGAAMNALRI